MCNLTLKVCNDRTARGAGGGLRFGTRGAYIWPRGFGVPNASPGGLDLAHPGTLTLTDQSHPISDAFAASLPFVGLRRPRTGECQI